MKKKLLLLGLMVAPLVADADDLRLNPEYVFSGDDVTITIMIPEVPAISSDDGNYQLSGYEATLVSPETLDYSSVALVACDEATQVTVRYDGGNDIISIKMAEPCGPCSAKVFDLKGDCLYSAKMQVDSSDTAIVTHLPMGVMIFTLVADNGEILYSSKITKQMR